MVENSEGKSDKTDIILKAAQKLFAHYGLVKTSMSEIAQDVGMSKASLYYYFKDKEAIFEEVITREQKEFISQVKKIMDKEGNASALLVTYSKKRFEYFKILMNISKLNAETIKSVKPIFSKLSRQFNDKEKLLIVQIFRQGITSGEFEKINASEHADLFISLINGLRSQLILRKGIELANTDFQLLEKQSVHLANLFSKGIKKQI